MSLLSPTSADLFNDDLFHLVTQHLSLNGFLLVIIKFSLQHGSALITIDLYLVVSLRQSVAVAAE